jgi:hypothetical protein
MMRDFTKPSALYRVDVNLWCVVPKSSRIVDVAPSSPPTAGVPRPSLGSRREAGERTSEAVSAESRPHSRLLDGDAVEVELVASPGCGYQGAQSPPLNDADNGAVQTLEFIHV